MQFRLFKVKTLLNNAFKLWVKKNPESLLVESCVDLLMCLAHSIIYLGLGNKNKIDLDEERVSFNYRIKEVICMKI